MHIQFVISNMQLVPDYKLGITRFTSLYVLASNYTFFFFIQQAYTNFPYRCLHLFQCQKHKRRRIQLVLQRASCTWFSLSLVQYAILKHTKQVQLIQSFFSSRRRIPYVKVDPHQITLSSASTLLRKVFHSVKVRIVHHHDLM